MEIEDYSRNFHSCHLCPYRTKSALTIINHLNQHYTGTKTDRFVCHSNSPEAYECQYCDAKAVLKVKLTNHINTTHGNKKIEDLITCYELGDFRTYSILVLAKHFFSKSQEKPKRIYKPVERSRKYLTWFKCDKCPFQTKEQRSLKFHSIRLHTALENITWFKCKQCSFRCKLERDLRSHTLINHINIKWFHCTQCEYKSLRLSSLKMHVLVKHTDDVDAMWFKCELCSYKSKVKYNWKMHMLAKHGLQSSNNNCSNQTGNNTQA